MASTAVEAPPQPPADAVPLGHDELVAARKQPWKTQTVSDRDKERKGRRNSDGKKPAAQGSEAASRARSEGPLPLKEGSRRSRSRSRSPRGRAARSRSPEQSRRPQSRSRERSPRGRRSRSRERRSRSGERRGGVANSQQQHSRSRERRKERPVPLERRQSSGEGSRPDSNAGSKPPPHSTTHSVAPARGEESKAQLCREQREQTRQARRREERKEAERSKGGSGQGGSTPKENSSRTSGGRLPVPPAVRPAATPTISLHYLDIQGPAEPARLALVVGGVPFEDVRYDRERMLKAKEAGELPYGQLPLLYVDGKCLAQSLAISEWCARQAGLVPADSFEQASSHAVMRHATPHSSTPCTHYMQAPSRRRSSRSSSTSRRTCASASSRRRCASLTLPRRRRSARRSTTRP